MYKVSSLSLSVDYSRQDLSLAVAEALSTTIDNIKNIILVKRSIDARKKSDVRYVISVAVELYDDEGVDGEPYIPPKSSLLDLGLERKNTAEKIYIAGSGPAGLFTALTLATYGVKSTILERGASLEERVEKVEILKSKGILDTETNVQFGEGGAGTFSDGKLGSGISNEYFGILYGEFIKSGAPDDIQYESAPHIGTDELRKVLKNLRERLVSLGVEYRTKAKLTDVEIKDGRIVGIEINGEEKARCDRLVLAIGHSAEDTFATLYSRGVGMEAKPFSIGVRAEHEQRLINESQYGKFASSLPPADYKLSFRLPSGRGVYTFCMCPGGEVVCSSDEYGTVVTNGMSERKRDGRYADSAILVSVTPEDYSDGALGGFEFRKRYEKAAFDCGGGGFFAPAQRITDFIRGKASEGKIETSYRPGTTAADLREVLPDFVADGIRIGLVEFGKKIKGFDRQGALIGVETRSSCPVRILRDENRESNIKGVYPCGEGSGYAGGITSSAVDGIKTAIAIASQIR